MTVGASDASICTRVLVSISAFPYRNTLIAKMLFRQILGYADSPSISISDLVSTVVSYFDMSTAMAERETKAVAISICDPIFYVDNISGFDFLTSKEESIIMNDPKKHPRDVSYFTFRLSLNPYIVDPRASNAVHQFKFSLRLPLNFPSSSVNLSLPSTSIITNQSSVTLFDATLS